MGMMIVICSFWMRFAQGFVPLCKDSSVVFTWEFVGAEGPSKDTSMVLGWFYFGRFMRGGHKATWMTQRKIGYQHQAWPWHLP